MFLYAPPTLHVGNWRGQTGEIETSVHTHMNHTHTKQCKRDRHTHTHREYSLPQELIDALMVRDLQRVHDENAGSTERRQPRDITHTVIDGGSTANSFTVNALTS